MLTPISRLSLARQKDAVEIPQMLAAERTMRVSLQNLKLLNMSDNESMLSSLLNTAALSGVASFMDVNLKNVSQGLAFFKSHYMQYVTNIEAGCNDRFCTKDSASLLSYTCILDTNLWPRF